MPDQDAEQLRQELKQLREKPVSTQDLNQQVLRRVFDYLVQDPLPANKKVHWFCSRVDSLTLEAATFLLRLHAYNSAQVLKWRQQLQACLKGCSECVQKLQEVKVSSRNTYFGAFAETILTRFYDSFAQWELETVLHFAQPDKDSPSTSTSLMKSFLDLPPSIALLMLSDLRFLKDQRILSILRAGVPTEAIEDWPHDNVAPPPVLFFLLADPSRELRSWASRQIALYIPTPLPAERFLPSHIEATEKLVDSIQSYKPGNPPSKWGDLYSFADDLPVLWNAFCTVVRFLPPDWLAGNGPLPQEVRKVILSHLSDTGAHYSEVFKTFAIALSSKRLGSKIWSGQSDEYPQLIFNTIKNNASFASILETIQPNEKHWSLAWIEVYIKTLARHPCLPTLFPVVIQYLCEELQQERYKAVRVSAICIAAKILESEVLDAQPEKKTQSRALTMVLDCVNIHAKVIASIAFEEAYHDDEWREARQRARSLISACLKHDAEALVHAVLSLIPPPPPPKPSKDSGTNKLKPGVRGNIETLADPGASASTKASPPELKVTDLFFPKAAEQVWARAYEFIQPSDSEAIALLIRPVLGIAHVDDLNKEAFTARIDDLDTREKAVRLVEFVNNALVTIRSGFCDAVSRYLDCTSTTALSKFMEGRSVIKHITTLMFSPVDSIRDPAQSLVVSSLNAESRRDCFRNLLNQDPPGAFEGMLYALQTFNKYAVAVPEACSLSKTLALCLTDIIDVLCTAPEGLLHHQEFRQKLDRPTILPYWWASMCGALRIIFKYTPSWSSFFENEVMTLWMRDALIFGRDMLAQMTVIEESVSASPTLLKASEKSRIRAQMVDDLQIVLSTVTGWLRLTDPELLYQSFTYLQSLLARMREEKAKILPETVQRLEKQIKNARKSDPKRPLSRLDSSRVDDLETALLAFQEAKVAPIVVESSDDEVQVISHKIKAPAERKKEKARERMSSGTEVEVVEVKKEAGATKAVEKPKRNYIMNQSRPDPARKPSGKTKISNYFTADDQRKLEASSSTIPKFTRPSTSASKSGLPSRPFAPPRRDSAATATLSEHSSAKSSAAEDSSSDSSESDDEKSAGGLASLSKLQRTPTIKKPTAHRGIKLLDVATEKHPALERLKQRDEQEERRRTGLRLKPDISSLHQVVLSWDYNHTGDTPPGQKADYRRVPDQFADPRQYRDVFEPLLLLECWAQIQQSKEADEKQHDAVITSRLYNGQWVDLEVSFPSSVDKDWSLSDTDVVLLTANGKLHLAKVQRYQTFGQEKITGTLRVVFSATDSGPQINSMWSLKKVISLTTLHREYAALLGMPYYDLCGTILKPRLPRPPYISPEKMQQAMTTYNLNEPQARAILCSLETNGFSLIQGPPGTGKTSTICGLVQAYLKQRARPVTAIHVGQTSGAADREIPKKILLCAPSNAAIDEITFRLKEGVSGPGKQLISPKVVRVGATKSMNVSVKDVSLDYLIDQKLNANPELKANTDGLSGDMSNLRAQLNKVREERAQTLEALDKASDPAQRSKLENEMKVHNKKRITLTSQLDKLRDQQKSNSRTMDATYRRFRAEVLMEADIICATLAGAGHEILEQFDFEMVVIDEAAQAIELSSLIPLKYRTSRCVMVGDPQQLPPTVISQQATKFGYNQSLFVRLQKHQPDAVHLLSIQYRMHPDISVLPSRLFYNGRLRDGPSMAEKTVKPWHTHPKFGPYKFFNVAGKERTGSFHSLVNTAEADVAIALYNRLRTEFASHDFDFKVGVVTMYRAQVTHLRRAFEARFGEKAGAIDFNTVDGFQGQEKDIIILSCVRAGPGLQTVGFLADTRRMNVALTRAKSSVFILGNAATLERSDENWRAIVNDARTRSCLVDADVSFFTSPITPAPAKVPVPRARVSSKTSAPAIAKPLPELSTPKQLAASQQRRVSGTAAPVSSSSTPVPMDVDPPEAPPPANAASAQNAADDDFPGLNGGPTPPDPNPAPVPKVQVPPPAMRPPAATKDPRPRPPKAPQKRQKAEASIFMPSKKPPKRPAPDGQGGSATNRPRV